MSDFSQYAENWHDSAGPLWTLHQLHDIRKDFILRHLKPRNKTCIDLACGGGLMTKFMSEQGCLTYGYDVDPKLLSIAEKQTQNISPSPIYKRIDLENEKPDAKADIVIACEIIEHLQRPITSFIELIDDCTTENGHVIISSLNKTLLSQTFGIWLTEEVLNWLPSGTHQHEDCVALDKLLSCMQEKFSLAGMQGLTYDIFTNKFVASSDVSVHYLCCFRKKDGS